MHIIKLFILTLLVTTNYLQGGFFSVSGDVTEIFPPPPISLQNNDYVDLTETRAFEENTVTLTSNLAVD